APRTRSDLMFRALAFFNYARERHAVYLRRRAKQPGPWTNDRVLQTYRFCNVFRELDRTTVWFRENVRDRYADSEQVLLATVLFRWFNRITTGEALFKQLSFGDTEHLSTAWEQMFEFDSDMLRDPQDIVRNLSTTIRAFCGMGPYVTGSYIIKTPDGL